MNKCKHCGKEIERLSSHSCHLGRLHMINITTKTKELMKHNKLYITLALLFNGIFSIIVIFYSEMFRAFFDNAQNGIVTNNIKFLLIAVGLILTQLVTHYLASLFTSKLNLNLKKELQLFVLSQALKKDQLSIDEFSSGEILNALSSDIEVIARLSSFILIRFIHTAFKTVIFVIYLFYLNVFLGFIALVLSPLMLLLAKLFSKSIRERSLEVSIQSSKTTSRYSDTLQINKFLKLYDQKKFVSQYVENEVDKLLKISQRSYKISLIYDEISSAFGQVANVTILFFGATFIANKSMTTGELVAFMQILNQIIWPLVSLSEMYGTLQSGKGKGKYIDSILKLPTHQSKVENFNDAAIEVSNVEFSYGNKQIYTNLNLRFEDNSLYLLKGFNGAGKTTLINLLLGVYKPSSGSISYPLDLDAEKYSEYIAYASQEPQLISGTISENINIADDIDQDLSWELFSKLDLDKDFPLLLETEVKFSGANVSGGQAKKISLIRALASNKKIIILDEPLANLDAESIESVKKVIAKLKLDKTIIIVDHGLNFDDISDQIITI